MSHPGTFLLTLPSGERVLCWAREAEAIRSDVRKTGTVHLIKDTRDDVYSRVAPESVEAQAMRDGIARVSE